MTEFVYLVYDSCDCDDGYCSGNTDFAVFLSEQTAKQEADLRSKRYGGHKNRPDMHYEKIAISTKTTGW